MMSPNCHCYSYHAAFSILWILHTVYWPGFCPDPVTLHTELLNMDSGRVPLVWIPTLSPVWFAMPPSFLCGFLLGPWDTQLLATALTITGHPVSVPPAAICGPSLHQVPQRIACEYLCLILISLDCQGPPTRISIWEALLGFISWTTATGKGGKHHSQRQDVRHLLERPGMGVPAGSWELYGQAWSFWRQLAILSTGMGSPLEVAGSSEHRHGTPAGHWEVCGYPFQLVSSLSSIFSCIFSLST